MSNSGYDPRYFDKLAAIENRHFWFRSRNRIISGVAHRLTSGWRSGYRVLEVGCGNGNVLQCLPEACKNGTVFGMDLFEEGLRHARLRTGCPLVRGDMRQAPLRPGFQLIGLFDVLEHLLDDHQVLRDLHALLAPAGTLLLTVPARMSLWSYFDESSHHCRRYSRSELGTKLKDAGFDVVYLTEFMSLLFPLVWIGRRLSALFHGGPDGSERSAELSSRDLSVVPIVNEVLTILLRLEEPFVSHRWTIPIGTSLLAIARKRAL